jgi:hypothetical protein
LIKFSHRGLRYLAAPFTEPLVLRQHLMEM